jgi:hypothetical protein
VGDGGGGNGGGGGGGGKTHPLQPTVGDPHKGLLHLGAVCSVAQPRSERCIHGSELIVHLVCENVPAKNASKCG